MASLRGRQQATCPVDSGISDGLLAGAVTSKKEAPYVSGKLEIIRASKKGKKEAGVVGLVFAKGGVTFRLWRAGGSMTAWVVDKDGQRNGRR